MESKTLISKKHNFSAGPAILPADVLKEAAAAVVDFNNSGLSILEISHRSAGFTAVMDEAQQLVREILDVPDSYEVLFLTGGASSQFFMSAINLLGENEKAAYLDTGTWSTKSIKEAALFGSIEVVASSKDKNYTYIPKGFSIPSDAKYLHLTSNNTIFGTQIQRWPETSIPFVCDMSSDIFSRRIDVSKFDLIYAGAQKNLGPAGTTLVIVKKDIVDQVDRKIPTMLNYKTHIAKGSMFNTPPVYPIYVCMLTLRWIKSLGGLAEMEKRNEEKATLFYNEVDRNALFYSPVEEEDRSKMNANFKLHDESLTDAFLVICEQNGCSGVKGHRSVGGFRASIYNAMPLESVQVLIETMKAFEEKNA